MKQIYKSLQIMKEKLKKQDSVTHVFSRKDYEKILVLLSDEHDILSDKNIHVKVILQDNILTVRFFYQ